MANYFVTTPNLPSPSKDDARWQLVCENGRLLVPDPRHGGPIHPSYIFGENGYCFGENECFTEHFIHANATAELVDLVDYLSA